MNYRSTILELEKEVKRFIYFKNQELSRITAISKHIDTSDDNFLNMSESDFTTIYTRNLLMIDIELAEYFLSDLDYWMNEFQIEENEK